MPVSLSRELRNDLASVTKDARDAGERAARAALENLAVHERQARGHMDEPKRKLRAQLRARGKAMGDARQTEGAQELTRLVEHAAYEHWHRLLFTRFLVENDLLVMPDETGGAPVSVTVEECDELAPEMGAKDGFDLACRFARHSLPGVFRVDDPILELAFAPEGQVALRKLLDSLPSDIFLASDSLGWTYQFWQDEQKKKINKSEIPRGADEIPAVTQLFTEDYMVDFLLDNTLGAWHAGKVLAANPKLAETVGSEEELRQALALPDCPWKYLRFIKGKDDKWTPAAGTFEGWPKTAKELTCLDPCMGSGHFVVAMFERLVALRVAEEKLDEAAAVEAVIRDNLFGLEIDPRCTQIGAFNLALVAWRRVGHCQLPAMNLACSGLAPNTREADWLAIAGDNQKLQRGMQRLYRLFQKAAVLGSLINPRASESDLLVAAFHELQPLLEKALAQEIQDDTAHEMAVTARGLAKAAEILAGQFTLIATNVPFLTEIKFAPLLRISVSEAYTPGKANLATAFILRIRTMIVNGGALAVVAPQSWWFLKRYARFRTTLLRVCELKMLVRLGENAFESSIGEQVGLNIIACENREDDPPVFTIDVGSSVDPRSKSLDLIKSSFRPISQARQLQNRDAMITFSEIRAIEHLGARASALRGVSSGDSPQFVRSIWEVPAVTDDWEFHQTTIPKTSLYGGMSELIFWQQEQGALARFADLVKDLNHAAQNWRRGKPNWGKRGVVVSQMGNFPSSLYTGEIYDPNCCAIVPHDQQDVAATWALCSSDEFRRLTREINQKRNVEVRTFLAIPFDLPHWRERAAEKYPHGLPKPFSSDPTQWLFNGHPAGADQPLHVAVARLLGYQWPRQTGSSFSDCPALGPDGLGKFSDDDGIVSLPPLNREAPAAQRVRELLATALGKFDERALITKAGPKGSKSTTIEDWLRDEFFEQHCDVFHQRPFIWHVWDGRKDGFHALVNYHKLDHARLNKLTFSYLGTWISDQAADAKAEKPGAAARLGAAKVLQAELSKILEGEAPYDLFVRWKPLNKQALGWHPDLNDGVRLNIRPFLQASDVGKKGAGVLRVKPNIKWDKDRGNEPQRAKEEYPWFWCKEEPDTDPKAGSAPVGARWNNVHLTLPTKRAARG